MIKLSRKISYDLMGKENFSVF